MSRETIVGFVKALEIFLEKDEKAEFDKWSVKAERMAEQLGMIDGVNTGIVYHRTIEEGMPMAPLCFIELGEEKFSISEKDVVMMLRDGDPSIEILFEPGFLLGECEGKIAINPEFMIEGDVEIVIDRITKIFYSHSISQ